MDQVPRLTVRLGGFTAGVSGTLDGQGRSARKAPSGELLYSGAKVQQQMTWNAMGTCLKHAHCLGFIAVKGTTVILLLIVIMRGVQAAEQRRVDEAARRREKQQAARQARAAAAAEAVRQRQRKEKAASMLRGPPPPLRHDFRLQPDLLGDLLVVWEFTQVRAEIFGT